MAKNSFQNSNPNMPDKCKIKIYPKAQKDIESIYLHISRVLFNDKAASDLLNELEKSLEVICEFPESCPLINNELVNDPTIRKLMVKKYIVFYRHKHDEIQVVRVLYGMSNYYSKL